MSEADLTAVEKELASLSRAVRFTLAALVLGLAFPNIHCSLAIDNFAAVFQDMLNNQPLPLLTDFVVRWRGLFVALSILFPLAAIAAVFPRKGARSVYLTGVLVLLTFGQMSLVWFALTGPFFSLIQNMSGGV